MYVHTCTYLFIILLHCLSHPFVMHYIITIWFDFTYFYFTFITIYFILSCLKFILFDLPLHALPLIMYLFIEITIIVFFATIIDALLLLMSFYYFQYSAVGLLSSFILAMWSTLYCSLYRNLNKTWEYVSWALCEILSQGMLWRQRLWGFSRSGLIQR